MKNKFVTKKVWAMILAAGRGKRMNAKFKNKVAYEIKGIPMIKRTINLLRSVGIENILVVVGYAKKSVVSLLDDKVKIAIQTKRLGTAHAVKVGLEKIPALAKNILVLNGDDSFLYSKDVLDKILNAHLEKHPALTFLTIEVDNPVGLGRVERDASGKVIAVVEDKDASKKQKLIKEINPACYFFSISCLRKYLPNLKKSKTTGEYYLTGIIEEFIKNSEKVEPVRVKNLRWRGVNTPEELRQAQTFI